MATIPLEEQLRVRLSRRRPDQSLDEFLTEDAVELAGDFAPVLKAGAIPISFDAGVLGALTGAPEKATADMERLVSRYSFISPDLKNQFIYYAPARQTIRDLMFRQEEENFRRLNGLAATFYERQGDPRLRMYHLLASGAADQAVGYELLMELFANAEQEYAQGVAQLLIRLALEQRPYLSSDYESGLPWLQGRLARLQGHPNRAIATFKELLKETLSPRLRPCVELSLAEAQLDAQENADAIESAAVAADGFLKTQDPFQQARALMTQSRAFAALGRSARGSGAVRQEIPDLVLRVGYEAASLLERLPILVFLMIQLGPQHILPVLDKVARDQDWVIARLFGRAVRLVRQAEALLNELRRGTSNVASSSEALWYEAHRTRANLYFSLGAPRNTAILLEDLLEHPLALSSPYRAARLRLELGEAHLADDHNELAAEEGRAVVGEFQAVGDLEHKARAHLLVGKALAAAAQERAPVRADLLGEAVGQLSAALNHYRDLNQPSNSAEVGRLLDDIAGIRQLPADHAVKTAARAAAALAPEREYPVRYMHPWIHHFRTTALVGMAVALLFILFFGISTNTGTDVGAGAFVRSTPLATLSDNFTPQLFVDVIPVRDLGLRVRVDFVLPAVLEVVLIYFLLYLLTGTSLIRLASFQALRQAQPERIAVGADAIRKYYPALDKEDRLPWDSIKEAYQVDRRLINRQIAGYSQMALYAPDISLQVPGRTTDYEDDLSKAIDAGLTIPLRRLGFSFVKSWAGVLFLLTCAALFAFLVVGTYWTERVLVNLVPPSMADVIPPYSASDLYVFLYLGLIIPLLWWLIVNPLREAYILKPEKKLPLAIGAAGVGLEALLFAQVPWLASRLPHPDIYPMLLACVMVVASAVYLVGAKHWEHLPARRTTHVYSTPVRIGAVILMLLGLGGGIYYLQREVFAYNALVRGNEARDRARNLLGGEGGDSAETLGALAEAANSYNQAIELSPYYAAGFASRAKVRSDEGILASQDPAVKQYTRDLLNTYDNAIRDYTTALELTSGSAILYANRANAYQGKALLEASNQTPIRFDSSFFHDLENAKSDFAMALQFDPRNPYYNTQRGVIAHELQQYFVAKQEYTLALKLDSRSPDAYAGRGWASFQIAIWEKSQDATAASVDEYLNASADFEIADQLLQERALSVPQADRHDLDLRRAYVLTGRAWVAYKLQQYRYALYFFEQARDLDPGNAEYPITYANIAWLVSRPLDHSTSEYFSLIQGAAQAYEENIEKYPDVPKRPYLYRTLGQFYFLLTYQTKVPDEDKRRYLEQGIKSDRNAIALDGTAPEYPLLKGRLMRSLAFLLLTSDRARALEQYEASITEFEHAMAIGAGIEPAKFSATNCKTNPAVNKDPYAKEACVAYVETNQLLAEKYQEDMRYADAIARYQAVLDAGVDAGAKSSALYQTLGWVMHLNKHDIEALEQMRKAVAQDPNNDDARFDAAFLDLASGGVGNVFDAYDQAITVASHLSSQKSQEVYQRAIGRLATLKTERPDLAGVVDSLTTILNNAITEAKKQQ